MRVGILALLALPPGLVQAGSWQFSTPLEVTALQGPGIFHHLESSGRRSIAVAGDRVAITWEDEHDGTPRVYVASKSLTGDAFATAPASDEGEAFEPTIVAIGERRFALAWEEDGSARLRLLSFDASGKAAFGVVQVLGAADAGQVSLAVRGDQLLAVWSERSGRFRQIRFARLPLDHPQRVTPAAGCTVDPEPVAADQLYPTLVATPQHTVVAWEDRRPGHTIIMAARADAAQPCRFSVPQRISEQPPGREAPYGKGHGVSRVALAVHGADQVAAVWADKRDYRHGYDIYGAALQADGRFGSNQRVQDDFGELSQQWHAALAGHPAGLLVAAWDDKREGHADVALSWTEEQRWSDDLMVPGASGPGEQQHPTLTFDAAGRLHLAWVHRDHPAGPTRLRYAVGSYAAGD